MGYSITSLSPYPSNQPINEANEYNQNDFPYLNQYPNGHRIWVSRPKPDMLDLVIPLVDEVLSEKMAEAVPIHERCAAIGKFLTSGAANSAMKNKPVPSFHPTEHYPVRFHIELGLGHAFIDCRMMGGKALGPRLRLSHNPSRFSQQDYKFLAALLFGSETLGAPALFRRPEFAIWAKITRVDAAIDCIGVSVGEIISRHSTAKGRTKISNVDGVETEYLWTKKPGNTQVRVYDKGAQCGSGYKHGFMSRIEVTRKGLHKKFLLDFLDLPDCFAKLRCGYVYSQGAKDWKRFQVYRAARAEHGTDGAQKLLGLPPSIVDAFENCLKVPNPDLLRPKHSWAGWKEACLSTGISAILPV